MKTVTTQLGPVQRSHELEGEIDHIRTRLDRSLAELDRRRHELTDVKLQLRRHPQILWVAGGVAALLLGGVAFAIAQSRKRTAPMRAARNYKGALRRAADHPERVARRSEPGVGEKILASVGTTIAVALAKKLIERTINSVPQQRVPVV